MKHAFLYVFRIKFMIFNLTILSFTQLYCQQKQAPEILNAPVDFQKGALGFDIDVQNNRTLDSLSIYTSVYATKDAASPVNMNKAAIILQVFDKDGNHIFEKITEGNDVQIFNQTVKMAFNMKSHSMRCWGFCYILYPDPVRKTGAMKMVFGTTYLYEYPGKTGKGNESLFNP